MEVQSAESLTDRLKNLSPPFARRLSRHFKAAIRNWRNRHLSAGEVFTRIYAEKRWGDGAGDFYSGPGSNAEAAQPYADFIANFIAQHDVRTVVDLGCGDFRVGGMIASSGVRYTGVDVVEPLIADNNRRFGSDSIRFECLDITRDDLPDGELCLIREVFQHISNAQISAVLPKLQKYRYVLFTDIQPDEVRGFKVNRDKIHGDSSRLIHRSFLRMDAAPFGVRDVRMVFETASPFYNSFTPYGNSFKLRTFLWRPCAESVLEGKDQATA